MRAAFSVAVRQGMIDADPTAELQRVLIPERITNLPDLALRQKALDAMTAYVNSVPPHRHTIRQVYLARWLFATGMRPAASIALTVGDVDLVARTVRIDGAHAKNGKTVVLPICQLAADVAEVAGGGRPPDDLLFRCKSCRGVLAAASAAIGQKLNPSTLRKVFATRAVESGMPIPMAARLLTHSDGGQTLTKHYLQWRMSALQSAVSKLDDFVGGGVE